MDSQTIADWAKQMIILDHSSDIIANDAMYYFAMDELLCKQAAKTDRSFCHIWRHPRSFVLGQRDYRLPHCDQARLWLQSLGYESIVRHSGGAAVPLDLDVVNVSLIFPISQSSSSFYYDFERMANLIIEVLAPYNSNVQAGEILGAYCPGDYDLSINGYKFCGIAQRRQLNAYCVQAFIVTGGSGQERAKLVRQFYERAAIGAEASSFPIVVDNSTASLEELTTMNKQATKLFISGVKDVLQSYHSELYQTDKHLSFIDIPSDEQVKHQSLILQQRYHR